MKLAWLFLSLINAQDRESKLKLKFGSPREILNGPGGVYGLSESSKS